MARLVRLLLFCLVASFFVAQIGAINWGTIGVLSGKTLKNKFDALLTKANVQATAQNTAWEVLLPIEGLKVNKKDVTLNIYARYNSIKAGGHDLEGISFKVRPQDGADATLENSRLDPDQTCVTFHVGYMPEKNKPTVLVLESKLAWVKGAGTTDMNCPFNGTQMFEFWDTISKNFGATYRHFDDGSSVPCKGSNGKFVALDTRIYFPLIGKDPFYFKMKGNYRPWVNCAGVNKKTYEAALTTLKTLKIGDINEIISDKNLLKEALVFPKDVKKQPKLLAGDFATEFKLPLVNWFSGFVKQQGTHARTCDLTQKIVEAVQGAHRISNATGRKKVIKDAVTILESKCRAYVNVFKQRRRR